ncbi:hypothetical protein DACRYDRAFT_23015 [Dacryopinax primogenitus]|uniref:Uncharacterized protein n=1 Tax=Dacryopinax primogenitus (strain DJM 731) TaxID=1858805 RepID=M5FXQ9_DACPD|nr:uncharacterized protein DACRYDRAFT_23015 [Dacryopinax primogenitus]EJU00570.1 hypothetical protein DACRYDRAFT_23015 [Dacryopinax primogenitus]
MRRMRVLVLMVLGPVLALTASNPLPLVRVLPDPELQVPIPLQQSHSHSQSEEQTPASRTPPQAADSSSYSPSG